MTAPALFYNTAELPRTQAYPLEEVNDYLRAFPDRAEVVRQTLAYYDLRAFAPRAPPPCSWQERQAPCWTRQPGATGDSPAGTGDGVCLGAIQL